MLKAILALTLILASPLVHAAETIFRDWRVTTETDAVMKVSVCRAYTQISTNLPFPVELSLSFPALFDRVPMMVLKLPANSAIARATIPFSSTDNEDLLIFQAVTDPAQKDLLWYVPVQMEKMVDIIIGNNALPLKFTQGGKEVAGRISLTGSTAALDQIARCLKVNEILPTKFFKELNTAAGSAPLGSDQSVAQLMIYVDQAFAHYREMIKTDTVLVKLRENMRALVQQETEALRALSAAQGNLDRATATAAVTREKIRAGEQRLIEIPGEIQTLQQQKPAAEQLLAQKKAIYDPIRQQVMQLERDIDSSESDVNSYSRAIRDRENTINNNNHQISRLQSEANQLDREVDDIDRELGPLERRKSQLEADLASYNVELEKQKILNSNSRYSSLRSERESLARDIRQKRQELNTAENRLARAQEKLRLCQSHTTTPTCDAEKNEVSQAQNQLRSAQENLRSCESAPAPRCDGQKNQVEAARVRMQQAREDLRRCERQPGQGQGQQGDPRPNPNCNPQKQALAQAEADFQIAREQLRQCESTSGPNCENEKREVRQSQNQLDRSQDQLRQCLSHVQVPSCDAEKNEVNQVSGEVSRLQSEVNNSESRLSSVNLEINRLEAEAQNQAIRGHDNLANELRRVAGEIADKRTAKERANDRIREINNSEIPRLQQEVSRAQGELPGLRSNLAAAQRELNRANAELQRYKSSVDYDRVGREYLAARRALDIIVNGISDKQNEQAQINRNLPGWRTQLQAQEREVARLTPIRDAAKTKLDGIQGQLEPARRQEKSLMDLMATLKLQYDELRKLYQTLANKLLSAP